MTVTTLAPQQIEMAFSVPGRLQGSREVEVRALRDVSLVLPEREFVVLLGPSGSGKSTLLNILGGLDVPSGGTVRYRDVDLTHATDAGLTLYRRRHVGFVFQFYNLIPSLTAEENVSLVTEISDHPMRPDEDSEPDVGYPRGRPITQSCRSPTTTTSP